MKSSATVVVGMSGGVDSAVSALLLKEQGYNVIGLFMKNWEELDERGICRSEQDFADVVLTCEHLQIPYYSVNFVTQYWDRVFAQFLNELKLGFTPNPDVLCNREIKFNVFYEKALSLGADFLATGHYCQIRNNQLLKGKDPHKDQSYFLNAISPSCLERVLFPVGHLTKPEVRAIAKTHGLPVHDKKDSTGICFIGKRNFRDFLSRYIAYQPGNFENTQGKVVGQHAGYAYYTIGQRKGLGIGGPGDAWFVVEKDVKRNVVVIEQGEDHPSLYTPSLMASEVNWLTQPPALPYRCTAKVRYRQPDQVCVIESMEDGIVSVRFEQPQRAVTPRQSIVFYEGDVCLGGASILSAELSEPLGLKG